VLYITIIEKDISRILLDKFHAVLDLDMYKRK
jgi:hypothetical protein